MPGINAGTDFWLVKTDPESYSIKDLAKEKRTAWTGVRNYQARNFMNAMEKGDSVLFYHSQEDPPSVVGVAKISRESYPDPTALDSKSHYYDPKSTPEKPIWTCVDIAFVRAFKNPVSLDAIRGDKRFQSMKLLQKGSRLSVQPVDEKHFRIVEKLGK